MNIFVTNSCPKISARNLDIVRQNKMLLESCQLLSTAVNYYGGKAPYKTSHLNHPASIWTRTSQGNYCWVVEHAKELARIYNLRTGRVHGCVKALDILIELEHLIPQGELTPFVNCAANKDKGVDYKHVDDVTLAYRLYLSDRWKTDIRPPNFFTGN